MDNVDGGLFTARSLTVDEFLTSLEGRFGNLKTRNQLLKIEEIQIGKAVVQETLTRRGGEIGGSGSWLPCRPLASRVNNFQEP